MTPADNTTSQHHTTTTIPHHYNIPPLTQTDTDTHTHTLTLTHSHSHTHTHTLTHSHSQGAGSTLCCRLCNLVTFTTARPGGGGQKKRWQTLGTEAMGLINGGGLIKQGTIKTRYAHKRCRYTVPATPPVTLGTHA